MTDLGYLGVGSWEALIVGSLLACVSDQPSMSSTVDDMYK
jgi:hypothetical protein